MKIKLQGIGIIKDSEIELSGLTVITGDNNSGKTTVGKVVYSLFDAVSNLSKRAELDKGYYIRDNLQMIVKDLDFLSVCFPTNNEYSESKSELARLFNDPRYINYKNAILLANKLYDWLGELLKYRFKNLDNDTYKMLVNTANMKFRRIDINDFTVTDYIIFEINYSLETLESLLSNLKNDPQLIDYARESIYQTLCVEFAGQIQPVITNVEKSSVVVEDMNKTCFQFDIKDNKIVNDGNPIFFASSIKRAFFVDNPFVLDSYQFIHRVEFNEPNDESILNRSRIFHHEDKLRIFLKNSTTNLFETNILEKQFGDINAKINDVVSGSFDFSRDGDYYIINNGRKLRFSNLATGSKLFSILKLLINKGALTDSTVLVLDEPEAHLHPAWQNKFAEIIVMLVKELNVKVLLTSHSSNFVLAIDAFMRKYGIKDKTNFYQTHLMEDGFAEYINVSDDMGLIYSDFVQYMTEVRLLRDIYYRGTEENND